jgi:signal transduction histidine kinase
MRWGRRAARLEGARRVRAEGDTLARLRAELEDAGRLRPELFSLLSHDLRNPLSSVMLSLDILGRALAPGDRARRHLETSRRGTGEMKQMLDVTSLAARIELGRLHVTYAEHDAGALVAVAVEAVRHAAESRGLTVEVRVAEGLGPVGGSRDMIVAALAGLLGRAIAVTPKSGAVVVRAEPDEEGVRFSVEDGGPPPPDALFEVPRTEDEKRATGQRFFLDLFVARGVVEAHGGQLSVGPLPGGGSVLGFTLPGG